MWPMATPTGQHRWSTFPSLQKVLLDSTSSAHVSTRDSGLCTLALLSPGWLFVGKKLSVLIFPRLHVHLQTNRFSGESSDRLNLDMLSSFC